MALRWRGALFLALLFAAGMDYYYCARFLPYSMAIRTAHQANGGYSFGTDFYPIWYTSRECLPHGRDPYSAEVTRQIQTGLFGREFSPANPSDPSPDYRAFSYPAFVDFFGILVAWMPFPVARIVLAILLPSLTAASVLLWSKALHWGANPPVLVIFVVLTLSSYPGLEGLFAQQFGLIVGFFLAAAILALTKSRLAWAGCLLAFASVKPQTTLLVTFYLLFWVLANWTERWKLAAGFGTTLAALTLSAILIWPNWIIGWLHVLSNYRNYSRPPLLGYLFGTHLGVFLIVLLLSWTVRFSWQMRHLSPASPEFGLTIGLLLAVTTIALLPEHAVYDHIILLPGIMVVAGTWREIRAQGGVVQWLLGLSVAALFWPWITALFVVIAGLVAPRFATAILFVPLRTAAAIPFIVVALLFLMTRRSGIASTAGIQTT